MDRKHLPRVDQRIHRSIGGKACVVPRHAPSISLFPLPLPSPLRWGSGAELYADIENVRTCKGADILDILSGEQPMQGACGLPFMFDLGDTHSHGASAEVTLNQVEDNRNKQRGQQVNGLAVLDAENGESGTDDEHTAYDAQFAAHGLGHGCTETEGNQVEHTLPAEEYRCGQ